MPGARGLRFLQGLCVGLVLVVLVTGTGFLVWLRGGGTQPEDVLPAGAAAFARIDLDPSAEQKLAIYEIRKRFPAASEDFSLKDDLVGGLLQASGIDYARDVRPWLGNRVGLAVLPGGSPGAEPQVLIALQYRDRGKARDGLTRRAAAATGLGTSLPAFAFVPDEHYVLVGASQAGVEAAATSPRRLTDDPAYAAGVDALAGDQLVVAWTDLARLAPLLPATGREQTEGLLGGPLTGSITLGVRAQDALLDVRGALVDLPKPTRDLLAGTAGTGLAGTLPAGTGLAVSGTGLGNAARLLSQRALGPAGGIALAAALRPYGVSWPGDLAALLGDEAALGVNGSDLLVRTLGGDLDLAGRVRKALAEVTPRYAPFLTTVVGVRGGTLLGTAGRVRAAQEEASLSGTSDYRRAVPDAQGARLVAYGQVGSALALVGELTGVDLETLTTLARPVKGVGLTVAPGNGDDVRVRLRITVGD